MSKTISLYVISHRPLNTKVFPDRKIIYVGKKENISSDNVITFKDNTGDNISSLNPDYCELTALYWVYKNRLDADYIGFEHYRRNFYHLFKIARSNYLIKRMRRVDVLHMQGWLSPMRLKKRFSKLEGLDYYKYLLKSLEEVAPEYIPSLNWLAKKHVCHYCNIFIMKRDVVRKYLGFLFKVVFKADEIAKKSSKNQKERWVGYIAELLLDIFIHHHKLKHKTNLVILNKRYRIK